MKNKQLPTPKRSGFSIVQILIGLVIMGIMSFMIVSNIPAIKRKSEDSSMRGKAHQLNTAISNYMSDHSVRAAIIGWRDKQPEERYALIRKYLGYAPENLSEYIVEGYTVEFPSDPRSQEGVKIYTPEKEMLQYR